jgi:hypothetical protein
MSRVFVFESRLIIILQSSYGMIYRNKRQWNEWMYIYRLLNMAHKVYGLPLV